VADWDDPVGHGTHATAPVTFEKVPAGHAPQAVCPATAAKRPRLHATQSGEVAFRDEPAGQSEQATAPPSPPVQLPASHATHAVRPEVPANWFTPHGTHCVAAGPGWAWPVGQSTQLAAPAKLEKRPGVQGAQAVSPGALAKRPAAQSSHSPRDTLWKRPGGHGVHATDPCNWFVVDPAAHPRQLVEPATSANAFTAHGLHVALAVAAWASPAGQSAHDTAPSCAARLPGEHASHSVRAL
jgi:hypothetical protein